MILRVPSAMVLMTKKLMGRTLKIYSLSPPILEDDEGENKTTPRESTRAPKTSLEDYRPQQQQTQQPVVTAARRRFFNKIITKCVLQPLMIETVPELSSNDAVYEEIPPNGLLMLVELPKKSYTFARRFNSGRELRMRLWREGFMKRPPSLPRQESGSAAACVSILLRMYDDEQVERRDSRGATEAALIPYTPLPLARWSPFCCANNIWDRIGYVWILSLVT